jgi:hypothetical protein
MSTELSRLLQQLGGEPAPEREQEQELARAAAVAQRLDHQLQALVRERRARLFRLVPLAAAAALLLGFGARQLAHSQGSSLAIEQEPLPPGSAQPAPRAAEPVSESRPAVPVLREDKPRALPSHSASASEPAPPVPSASTDAPSTLADENQLFKDAAEATRAGNTEGALGHLNQLLEKYPASPLAQTALVRKLRLLAKAGRTSEATQAASRYLELYPTGFAAAEAQQLVSGTPERP